MTRPEVCGRRPPLPAPLERELWEWILESAAVERREPLLGLRDEAICALFLFSGLRSGELIALDLEDVELRHCRLRVRRPNGETRRPAVSAAAVACLEAYLEFRPAPRAGAGNPLFISRKGGRMDASAVRRLVYRVERALPQAIRERLPPGGLHPRLLRHSHVAQIVRQSARTGKSLEAVAEQADHRDLRTTRRYYRL